RRCLIYGKLLLSVRLSLMTGLVSGSHQYRIVSIPVKCQLRPVDRHVWILLIGHILPLKLIQPYGLAVAGDGDVHFPGIEVTLTYIYGGSSVSVVIFRLMQEILVIGIVVVVHLYHRSG